MQYRMQSPNNILLLHSGVNTATYRLLTLRYFSYGKKNSSVLDIKRFGYAATKVSESLARSLS